MGQVQGLDNVGVGVRDLEASLAFYRDLIECEVQEHDQDGRTATLGSGNGVLYLFETKGQDALRRTDDLPNNPVGVDHLSFAVEDVDAFHQQAVAKGHGFFMDPNDAEYGARICGLYDPNGIPVYALKWL